MKRNDRSQLFTSLARSLRANQTDTEQLLWSRLRNRRLLGYKFRRQFSVPPHIADFCCEEAKLIIEVDGGQHDELREADAVRTKYFERRGYRVLRFWNNEVQGNIEGVLYVITEALGAAEN